MSDMYYRVIRDDCDGDVGGAFSSKQKAREMAESLNEEYDTDVYTVSETDDVQFHEILSGTIIDTLEKS